MEVPNVERVLILIVDVEELDGWLVDCLTDDTGEAVTELVDIGLTLSKRLDLVWRLDTLDTDDALVDGGEMMLACSVFKAIFLQPSGAPVPMLRMSFPQT